MITRLLVANRGEIAVRIMRACDELGIETVAVYSDADADAVHVRAARRAIRIGASAPAESYLSSARLIGAARASGADAVHPGYGFLAEHAACAAACRDAGLIFVGPPPDAIAAMGSKIAARRRYVVRQDSTSTIIEVLADGRVRVGDGDALGVTPVGDGRYVVPDGQEEWRVRVAGPADGRFVCARGASGRVEIEVEGRAPRKTSRAGSGETSAPMPATVIEITVEVGQQVSAGTILLILEAMKMELPIRAPRDGTVTAIRCQAGELVQPGVPLVDIG